jgi:hypothetical protein
VWQAVVAVVVVVVSATACSQGSSAQYNNGPPHPRELNSDYAPKLCLPGCVYAVPHRHLVQTMSVARDVAARFSRSHWQAALGPLLKLWDTLMASAGKCPPAGATSRGSCA